MSEFGMKFLLASLLAVLAPGLAAAATETVLHTFQGGADGANPNSRLLLSNGNLFGTTSGGGSGACSGGCGTVFELPTTGINVADTILYSFQGGDDGAYPNNENLVIDPSGNLFGVTQYGGKYGDGVVFELEPPEGGRLKWLEKPIYSFPGGMNGAVPETYLLRSADGTLYGTTSQGGNTGCGGNGCGIVFSLRPPAQGHVQWSFRRLHVFRGGKSDGATPQAGPIADSVGNLFGITIAGGGIGCGGAGCGTAYELSPPAQGQTIWKETVIHRFAKQAYGLAPVGNLLLGDNGELYGSAGGGVGKCGGPIIFGCGVDFELTKSGDTWTETVLHASKGKVNGYFDGSYPNGDFIEDATGTLFGATYGGGLPQFGGTVFKLTPVNGGGWTETILYGFAGGNDGSGPQAGVVEDNSGAVFGVTVQGGSANLGIVYKLTP